MTERRRDSRRVLVTGGGGFVGRHLLLDLARRGHELAATVRPGSRSAAPEGAHRVVPWEMPDAAALTAALEGFRPDAVVHLAAMSRPLEADEDPEQALRSNVDGVRCLIEALERTDPAQRCGVVLASSAHVYGAPPSGGESPLDEAAPLAPRGVYARTKLASELAAQCLCGDAGDRRSRPLIIFRSFHHTGPGQDARFALSGFAQAIARIEAGLCGPSLATGDLEVVRDFTDVRDVARAYGLAAEGQVPAGTYNVASGSGSALRGLLDVLVGLARAPVAVAPQAERFRPGEARRLVGTAAKLARACGWRPEIPLEKTLADMLEWWRARVKESESVSG